LIDVISQLLQSAAYGQLASKNYAREIAALS